MHFFQDRNVGGTNMSIRSTYAWISSTLSVNPFALIYLSLLFVNVSEVGIKKWNNASFNSSKCLNVDYMICLGKP